MSRPIEPMGFISNCVMISSSLSRWSGTSSMSGRSPMTTPAACVPWLRGRPSSTRAYFMMRLAFASFCVISRNSGLIFSAASSVMPGGCSGIILASLSHSKSGISRTRPMSRITVFEPSVPNVMICATLSRPYFCFTYSMTSPRRDWQKSMSKSGGDTRSGFRNRSKMRW